MAAPAGASRRQVLDAAARRFRREGYAAVSLRDIAAAAGMKAGSLYYHFASKDEIVVAVLDAGVQRVHAAVAAALAALPPDTKLPPMLYAAILAHLHALYDADDYTSANIRIFGQVPAAIRAAHLPVRRAYEALWADLLRRHMIEGALRDDIGIPRLRAFLLGAMNASLDWSKPTRAPIERIAADLTSLVLHGAARQPPP